MSAFDLILVGLFFCSAFCVMLYNFMKLTKSQQESKIKEWLLFAVVQAEKQLGGGTGKIKLRLVYDMFVTKFKFFSMLITFEQFSLLVDDALEEMKNITKDNVSISNYIKGSE
jgi:hypothetical protein